MPMAKCIIFCAGGDHTVNGATGKFFAGRPLQIGCHLLHNRIAAQNNDIGLNQSLGSSQIGRRNIVIFICSCRVIYIKMKMTNNEN